MSNFDLDGEMQFEVNLNISRFIRDAVRKKMKRAEIMVYLHLVSITYEATDNSKWRHHLEALSRFSEGSTSSCSKVSVRG